MGKQLNNLNNKVVVITGAGRGLGAGLARRVIDDGGCVAVLDIDPDNVKETAAALGPHAKGYVADVTSLEQMDNIMRRVRHDFGRIDAVVVNAGVLALGSIEHMDPDQFKRVMDVNVHGAFHTIRTSIPYLRETKGYLLVMASLASAIHTPLMSHYAASKAGVEALADVARQELASDGISVGCLHPTFVRTPMLSEAHSTGATDKLWGGNTGLFNAVEPELVVEAMHKAIVKRARKIIAPKLITPVILAPGLFHWVADAAGKLQGAPAAVKQMQDTERSRQKSV